LPVYWASTTLTSRNIVFFLVLAGLALLATFDPWFRAIVHPRPWAGAVFFFVCVFGALDVALPLVGFPPRFALMVSAGAGVIALAPALCMARKWPWRVSAAVSALAAFVLAGARRAPRGLSHVLAQDVVPRRRRRPMVGRRDDRLGTAHRPLPVPRDPVSPPELFDTHAHLHFPEFTSDLPDVLTRAREAGV